MTPLERFAALLNELHAADEVKIREAILNDYHAALREVWATKKKGKPFDVRKAEALLGDGLEAFMQPFRDRVKAAADAASNRRDLIEDELHELAPQIDLTPAPDVWNVYATSWPDSYRTISGGERYAPAMAEMMRREAALHCPTARTHKDETTGGITVLVPLEPVRVEALRRRDGMTVRDFLKACWGLGVNPRVYRPLLAHGLEEQYGLDYFGGEIVRPKLNGG